jgi:tetratricopeptide (TPR) repeat protein
MVLMLLIVAALCQVLLATPSIQETDAGLEQQLLAADTAQAVALVANAPEKTKALLDRLLDEIDHSVRSHRDSPEQRKVQFSRDSLDRAIRISEVYSRATDDTRPYRRFVARRQRLEGTALLNARRYRDALSTLQPVLAEAEALEDRWLEMTAHTSLAYAYLELGDRDRTLQQAEAAVAAASSQGDRARTLALYNLGSTHVHFGRMSAALEPLTAAVTLARDAKNDMWLGNAALSLGVAYRQLGQRDEAERATQEALDALTRAGDRLGIGRSLYNLGLMAFERRDFAAASGYMERALPVIRDVDIRHSHEIEEDEAHRYNEIEEHALSVLVESYTRAGEPSRAETHRVALEQVRSRKPAAAHGHAHPPGR